MPPRLMCVACQAITFWIGIALTQTAHGAQESAQRVTGRPPNIVFIFSDDHAYQAISAYNDPRRLIETPHIDRLAREGMRFDRCVVPNSICGPSRASVLTGQVLPRQRLLQQHQQPLRRLADDLPQAAPCGRLPDGLDRQVAPGHRPDRLRPVAHPAGAGGLLQPADDPQRPASAAPGLHDRHHHRPFPRLAEEQRDKSQAVSAHVPAQGAASRVAAGDPPPGPRPRSPLSRAANAVRRLLRTRQGRARPGHDDRQDDDRDRPQADASDRPDGRTAPGLGRLLRAAQRRLPGRRASRAETS